VLADLERRPKLLLVFRPARDLPVNGYRRLDYVAYFSRDPEIGKILRDYQLMAQTRDYLVYEWTPAAQRTGPAPAVAAATSDVVVTREAGGSLRLGDPRLLVAVLTFLGSLIATGLTRRRVPQMPR
jgi:hypothetical protein